MASGGAPPFPGSGLAELELLEEGDTSSTALRLTGTATPVYATTLTAFYAGATNSPAFAWQPHASGLMGWKVTEGATTNSAKWGTNFGVPLYLNFASYTQQAIRHRRYQYAALVARSTVPSVGECAVGLYQPTATGGFTTGGERGVALRSVAGVYGGNWHVARRWYTADPVTVLADTGIPATAAPFLVLFDFRSGPNGRSLVVSIGGVTVATFAEADLPQLGPDGSFIAATPGFYSIVTGTPGFFQVMQSRFRQDRLT